MAVLFIARFRPDRYEYLGTEKGQRPLRRADGEWRTDDQQGAREIARKLFGWEYVRKGYPYQTNGDASADQDTLADEDEIEPEPLRGEPSSGVDIHVSHAFLYSKGDPSRLGWMAIVSDATFGLMKQTIGWPNSPFCQMYMIEILPLNEDTKRPKTQLVYAYMTPESWGPTISA